MKPTYEELEEKYYRMKDLLYNAAEWIFNFYPSLDTYVSALKHIGFAEDEIVNYVIDGYLKLGYSVEQVHNLVKELA